MSDKPLGITDVVLRDASQSLLATRIRLDDMLPIAEKLDSVGYWSVESWGGATFDACIRYLGEDPWERIRELKKAMPNTPQQMLLRGQNILGYRHYSDDVVKKFVDTSVKNGVDVFRVFDAMNDTRNLKTAIKSVRENGKHAQGTISYTISPVHSLDTWIQLSKEIEDLGADSLAIKDMAGLLKPYVAFELVAKLKKSLKIPIHMQCHATTGMSTATAIKAVEAGIDNIDTSISSMSMTYGHSATESIVAILQDTPRATGLDLRLLEEIAAYFRPIRAKYSKFEGSLKGVDSRILVAQVPGGMFTNMENQLREQRASDKLNEVLEEIPKVREDLGLIPLVTPTSQIVGTQAVLNVLSGERYKNISKETTDLLAGEYGKTPSPVKEEIQKLAIGEKKPITCRPADLLDPEIDKLRNEFKKKAKELNFDADLDSDEDLLTYSIFPQVAEKFFTNRNNKDFFEEHPTEVIEQAEGTYKVIVEEEEFIVKVKEYETELVPSQTPKRKDKDISTSSRAKNEINIESPLSGNVRKVLAKLGDKVKKGQVVVILEAMKMETEVQSTEEGRVSTIHISEGDEVVVDQVMLTLY
ncbi:MAG: oxaloacetate decarboxylase subunit alpha [Gammaproteobacteria bacterium]|nr:oxaloacetate decarboxylase subunit alpha [Gammaproteobacteria bacterium]